jgi:flagellin-like protein
MEKRGLSAIVTTLMFILLAFVAVSVVWVVVNNVLERGAGSVDLSSKCLEFDFEVTQTNCNAGVSGDDCSITVKRNAGGDDVAGIKLVLTNASAESNYVHTESGNIAVLGLKTIPIPGTGISNVNSAEVFAYLEDEFGNQQDCAI